MQPWGTPQTISKVSVPTQITTSIKNGAQKQTVWQINLYTYRAEFKFISLNKM